VADSVTPLCTAAQFNEGAFADLARTYSTDALNDILIEATRVCEDETQRRLAPFTGLTETVRADGVDPDEYTDAANLPMDIQSTLGASYAQALGASSLVRHCWLSEFAPRYQDLWTYNNASITIIRSYGGTQDVSAAQILNGPEPDTGHLWFQLGIFLPIGSRVQVTYGGGYTVAIPASLVRACKYMAASIIVRELDPTASGHDADELHVDALMYLSSWERS
jgi:hypothetical protein